MRTHQQIDERSLALHRLVAETLRREPARFERARTTLARFRKVADVRSQPYLKVWEGLFEEGLEKTLAMATEDSERGAALRQTSPFAGVLTPAERAAFFRRWRGEGR